MNRNFNKGFTLIELIVVLAVFLLIIGAAIGIFLSIIQRQRMILSEQELLNQTSYAEEYMSKALRMAEKDPDGSCLGTSGDIYLLTRPVDGVYTGIKFMNASDSDACQEFFLAGDGSSANPYILKELKTYSPYTPLTDDKAVSLTSTDLDISSIKFSVDGLDGSVNGQGCSGNPNECGASATDFTQPRVTILMNIKISGGDQDDPESAPRIIQTTVSQRNLIK